MRADEKRLAERMEALVGQMEKMGLAEYARYLDSPRRVFARNLLAGAARGVGLALGFAALGAAITAALRRALVRGMPGISSFLADMVRIIRAKL